MSSSTLPPVLLTGASGVVGQALLPLLADREVICLTHRATVDGESVTSINGDLTQPRLGLEPGVYAELADRVGAVVHCAAITGFTAGKDNTDDLNVRGTGHVIELARDAGIPLHHVSTAFVTRGDLRDEDNTARPDIYIESKQAGERLVQDSGLEFNIVRPSVVIGDSVSGKIAQFQAFHNIVGAILKSGLPMMPLDPATGVDVIPQDYVAAVIADLVRTGVTGQERWVTCGKNALSAQQILDLTLEVGHELGLAPASPRFVAPDSVQRLIRPVFLASLPERQRAQFDGMFAVTALFCTEEPFPQDLGPNVTPPSTEDLTDGWRASLRYYAETKGIVARAGAAA